MRIAKYLLVIMMGLLLGVLALVYLLPEKVVAWAIDAERSRAGLVRKEIVLADGMRFVYLEGGQGEPLLLVHGFGANKDAFSRVAEFLTPHFHLIIPDLLGFGESDRPQAADYAPVEQAARLRALAEALGLKQLHLGGSSMGGHIALSYAARYPAEVQSLWLLDAGGIRSVPDASSSNVPVSVRSGEDLKKVMEFNMSEPPFIPAPMLKVLAQERIRNHDLEQRILPQVMADSVEARIADLRMPTLIVWGEQDRTLGIATADKLHTLLKNSQLIVMPGIGHLPMLERPQQTAEDYLGYRAALDSSTQ